MLGAAWASSRRHTVKWGSMGAERGGVHAVRAAGAALVEWAAWRGGLQGSFDGVGCMERRQPQELQLPDLHSAVSGTWNKLLMDKGSPLSWARLHLGLPHTTMIDTVKVKARLACLKEMPWGVEQPACCP